MKKLISILLICALAASLAACGAKKENTAPVIHGVQDLFTEAGTEFDAFAGVTASDEEDGDISAKITVEAMPNLDFKNGKATPATAGSYELTYSVTDKAGLATQAYATLTVAKQTAEQVEYLTFDFDATPTADAKGWVAGIGESASAVAELKQGAYVFEIANPGNGDGDVQLKLPGMKVTKADYVVKIWAKSTADTYCHILARNEQAEGWETFGGDFNVHIGAEIAPLTLNFSCAEEGSCELMLNLGKITPNPDNAEDTTPENFTVTVDKIEVYEITGEETLAAAYTSTDAANANVEAGDGASAEAADGKVTISSYPTQGGVWSIKANLPLDTTVENGVKYYYRFTVAAENAQGGECLIESASQYDKVRANFAGFSIDAGETKEVFGTFTSGTAIEDPVIRLQIGNPSDGVSSNTLVFSNVEFGKVEGDKDTAKTTYNFAPVGRNTVNENNPDYPFMTFNGTDEENERGVGTIWQENGSFFYRIDNGGTVDWHNKLILGYGETPLTLAADSYYTVVITAKATKDVSCGVFLNPCGGWDPRFSESMNLTTQEQTFTFETTDTFITDMDFELLFQFGSEATAHLGEVTIEITDITIYQRSVI